MTDLRLVTDHGTPTLPVGPLTNVASEARAFADDLDDGQIGGVTSAIVITSGTHLATHYWGSGLGLVEAIGVLEAAKHHILRKLLSDV